MLINILGKRVDSVCAELKAKSLDNKLFGMVLLEFHRNNEFVTGPKANWQSFFDSFQVAYVNKYRKSFEINE